MTTANRRLAKLSLAVFLFVPAFGVCRANLGDTEAQCIAKYGSETDVQTDLGDRQVGDKAATFNIKAVHGEIVLRIVFLNGLSCHETYSNADSAHGLSEAQMKAILDSQSAGLTWRKGRTVYRTSNSAYQTYGAMDWQRSDGATCRFWISGKADSQSASGEVELSTKPYADAQRFYDKENGE